MSSHCAVGCTAHPFASDWGATCTLLVGHDGAHMFQSAWYPDAHDRADSKDAA